jgi:hypothetical protein
MLSHRYKGGISGASPLEIQLSADATHPLYVVGFSAMGENASGSASKPVLTRPSSPGVGTGSALPLSPSSPTASGSLVTSFSSPPSLPSVNVGAFNLPLRLRWMASPGQEVVLGVSGSLLLYAYASGGHTWSGELLWEER